MKKLNKIYALLILTMTLITVSCSKKDVPLFLKRNSDAMNFSYLNTTKDLTILSNGKWKVTSQNDWISLDPAEGTGDGKTEQIIKVTVKQNTDDARSGEIFLENDIKSFSINIAQEEGHLVLNKPVMAPSFIINEELIGQRIQIPYIKGATTDKATVTASLQGPGSAGLTVEDLHDFELNAGEDFIPVIIKGTPTALGEIQVTLHVEIPSRSIVEDLIVKSRTKLEDNGLDPLESPTVTVVQLLPRLAVLDWGKYTKGSGISRKFELELATSQYGSAIRRYANQTDWLNSTSIGTGSYFFDHNRFVFADLEPGTAYWFRIVHKTINAQNLDSDISYFQFTTPAEDVLGPNVILYKDFDDFWWGGSPIYQAFGVQPTEAQIQASLNPKSSTAKSTDYRTMSWNNNIGSTFDGNLGPDKAPLLYNAYWDGAKYGSNFTSSGYAGWHGANAFAASGCMRLATASAQGYLKTPKLEKITGTADILVTVNTAAYYEPYHSWGEDVLRHYIIVEGDGAITDGGPTLSTTDNNKQIIVQCAPNVSSSTKGPLYNTNRTTTHKVKISGATSNTRIVIKTLPYSGADHYRIWLDDIKITKE